MEKKTYNGWSNYETWNVNLWLTNEEGSNSYLEEIVREACESNDERDDAIAQVRDTLKNMIEEDMPKVNGLYADLLQAAIDSCDFWEIAENHVSDNWDEIKAEAS